MKPEIEHIKTNDESEASTVNDNHAGNNRPFPRPLSLIKEKFAENGLQLDRRQAIGVVIIIIMMIAGILISYMNSQPHPINEFPANEAGAKNGMDGSTKSADTSIATSREGDKENSRDVRVSGSAKPPSDVNVKGESFVTVHVAGAVTKPGVYKLKDGSRINDAINAAGGGVPMSDINALNLAEKVQDAQKIYVPKRGETPSNSSQGTFSSVAGNSAIAGVGINGSAISAAKSIASGSSKGVDMQLDASKINLNTATIDQLDALPGVGQVTAQRIIDYRAQHGAFKSVSELQEVEGIGSKKFDQLKPRVTIN